MSDTRKHRIPLLLLVRLALLTALSAILKLAQIPVGNDFLRISFENLPLLLAGYLFGPLAGGITGVCADLLGCLLRGYAVNPIITLGAGLVGVMAGLFGKRGVTAKPRLWLSVVAAHLVDQLVPALNGIAEKFVRSAAKRGVKDAVTEQVKNFLKQNDPDVTDERVAALLEKV